MPLNETTAPISVRPLLSAAISCATLKSACWMRMVAVTDMKGSTAGHWREECNLARARYHGILLDVGVVDRGADHLRLFEGVRIRLAAARQPADQVIHRAHVGRRLDGFFRDADPLTHPGEIFDPHPSSSLMR